MADPHANGEKQDDKALTPCTGAIKGCREYVYNSFVAVCGDYKEPEKVPNHADPARRNSRTLLVIAVVAAYMGLFCSMFSRADTIYTKRIYSSRFSTDSMNVFNVSGGEIVGFRSKRGTHRVYCPCENDTLVWSSFVHFYSYPPGQQQTNRTLLNNSTAFCHDIIYERLAKANRINSSNVELLYYSCLEVFSSLLSKASDTNNTTCSLPAEYRLLKGAIGTAAYIPQPCFTAFQQIVSSALMEPHVFLLTVLGRVTESHNARISFALPWMPLEDKYAMAAVSNAMYAFGRTMLDSMLLQEMDPVGHSGTQLHAEFFGEDIGIGVLLSWATYFTDCAPAYCDVLMAKSEVGRVYDVVVELGGFLSAATFSVQQFVWPILCFLLLDKLVGLLARMKGSERYRKLKRIKFKALW